ncbi:MAG: hypothetical protein CL685_01775 [Candidatus Magasanikbacteria bacterium]|nr:hypothetical protein [Candidatus Magasanikbacteria bacterium]|tara:strand:- start:2847 stop:3452 length:606 start_codon:yes stop_codon:yes gene_type:complete
MTRVIALTITLIRHGQTEWNLLKKLQGQRNSPLTKKGVEEAKKLHRITSKEHYDAIYCSDLGRARQTAQYALSVDQYTEVKFSGYLRERSFGDFDGVLLSELKKNTQDFHNLYHNNTHIPPNGESIEQVKTRIRLCLAYAKTHHKGQHVLAISHGNFIKYFHDTIGEEGTHPGNTSISQVIFYEDGTHIIPLWGDTTHLCD